MRKTNLSGEIVHYRGEYIHRDPAEGPAVYHPTNGTFTYYYNDDIHRPEGEGPAARYSDGTEEWWNRGDLYKQVTPDGTIKHWHNYRLHRLHAPAVIRLDGTTDHYVNGIQYKAGTTPTLRGKWLESIDDAPCLTRPDGTLEWRKYSEFHREGGPAVVFPDGRCQHWIDGKRRNWQKSARKR
jgi:hypothetical protein